MLMTSATSPWGKSHLPAFRAARDSDPTDLPLSASPADDGGPLLSTDIPDILPITAAELDMLEGHFGEFIQCLLAGNQADDQATP
jgi:hypothetical protein